MTERCACCDRPLSPVARFGSWCDNCVNGVLVDANLLRADADTRGVVDWLMARGCLTLARYAMGGLPFDAAIMDLEK